MRGKGVQKQRGVEITAPQLEIGVVQPHDWAGCKRAQMLSLVDRAGLSS